MKLLTCQSLTICAAAALLAGCGAPSPSVAAEVAGSP